MGKRNKIRYTAKPVERIEIVLSGKSWLQFSDEDINDHAVKGDVLFYAHYSGQNAPAEARYDVVGFVGYLKMDVYDGRKWCPLLPAGIFEQSEHHFSKRERAFDTYQLCREIIDAMKGRIVLRTYREHYTLDTHAE